MSVEDPIRLGQSGRRLDTELTLKLENISSRDALSREWYPLLTEIFPDKDDQESEAELFERFNHPEKNFFYILRDEKRDDRAVGIELRQVDPDVPGPMYVPWAGLTKEYRNKAIYPRMSRICDEQMEQVGVRYRLFEVEDPARISAAYPDEPVERIQSQTEGRINFWRRNGCYIVRPLEPGAAYVRPASSDKLKIQAYDLMAFSVLNSDDPMWGDVFNADKTAIGKSAYRRFYLEMTRLQYGALSEAALRQRLPAVDLFLSNLDACSCPWLLLEGRPLRPSHSVTPRIAMRAAFPTDR